MQVKYTATKIVESGQLLLAVVFDDDGVERTWVPKWSDIRHIGETATLIEYANAKGKNNDEFRAFLKTAEFMRKVASNVFD